MNQPVSEPDRRPRSPELLVTGWIILRTGPPRASETGIWGETWAYPLGKMLVHVVNHSTDHRCQVATMLRQPGKTPLATDYLAYLYGEARR